MHTRIKICCIGSEEEASTAIRLGADALGLVGKMPSGPGVISDTTAKKIVAKIPATVDSFLLTGETTATHIADHTRSVGTNTVQIVNHIGARESRKLAEILPEVRKVQVIHVEDETALELIDLYQHNVDAFLLDSGRPSARIPELGGTGRVHDWSISRKFVKGTKRPVFLAGGLDHLNVAEAIRQVEPYGVDLCSGVRTEGKLDAQKLEMFIKAVRSLNSSN